MHIAPEVLLERYLAISRAIAGQLDLQAVLGEIAKEAHLLFCHDHLDVAIILPRKPDECISFEVGVTTEWGRAPRAPNLVALSPVRDVLLGKVGHILTGDAWSDERFHFDGSFDAPIYDADLRSRLHVPLVVLGEIIGSLNISRHKKNVYDQDDVQIARQIADLLAPYFHAVMRADQVKQLALAEGAARGREEALRLGTLRLTEGMENERKRIGMDLHDQTLADLTRISRQFARISKNGQPEKKDLLSLETEIANCVSELRRIIEDTKPGVLELFGFAEAVEAQLERSVGGISPKIVTTVDDRSGSFIDGLREPVRTTLFRIVQEAINNAVRHGNPSRVCVRIEVVGSRLRIAVVDDGSGTGPGHHQSTGGLDNMRVRAALISATLEVGSNRSDEGTCISVLLPVLAVQTRGVELEAAEA